MNLLAIVWAQAMRRPLQTVLSLVLLALGVATLVFVLLAQTQLARQVTRDAQGIDLVVGAKGSPLQLILAAVYHVDVPTGNVPLAAVDKLRANRYVAQAIPLALGDNHRGFRIVGSEPALIEHYGGRLVAGALWRDRMQAVLGATVARETGLAVGARFFGTHGLATGGAVHEDAEYRVAGVLAPTGTVLDRLILTDLKSVWFVHEGEANDPEERKVLEAEREVTALLVRYATPLAAALLPRQVNAEPALMAAVPANELARLFAVVGVGVDTMRAFGGILMGAALLALFVALMNALEERRYDLAIMRLLGASRARVAALLLVEAWLLAATALAVGFALGLLAVHLVGAWLAQARSFGLTPFAWTPELALVVAAALATATIAALVPAWRASRMDVHATLAQG
ncbi:ABC transporter permease [Betaproteobacteria bacterium PRO7]|jgi:putative ABC transport system permease protein|nr:ABC transporter permease [Betaproteobacteria bacterium PRO7]GIL06192.1 MAG: peptide ABC transporter permease [Betaproteobacteria bacterium]